VFEIKQDLRRVKLRMLPQKNPTREATYRRTQCLASGYGYVFTEDVSTSAP